MLSRALILPLVFLAMTASAADYDVQIGAFRNPDVASIEVNASIGELRTTSGADGLTRFLVGPFATRAEAEQARNALRADGYRGAFIRVSAPSRRAAAPETERAGTGRQGESASLSQRDLDRLSRLSDEERQNVVYLDGRLHAKVGDEFVPLRD